MEVPSSFILYRKDKNARWSGLVLAAFYHDGV